MTRNTTVMSNVCFIFITVLFLFTTIGGVDEIPEYKDRNVCTGFRDPAGINFKDPAYSYHAVQKTFNKNCTHIIGSVVLNNLVGDVDLSFLNSIIEIGGSLIIVSLKNVTRVSFRSLRLIRGHIGYTIKKTHSLYIAHNKKLNDKNGIIDLGSLTSVLRHDIRVWYNEGYCQLKNVDWNSFLETKEQKATFNPGPGCPDVKCSTNCPVVKGGHRFCYGPTKDMCQSVSNCSRDRCDSNRCLWDAATNTERCCHEQCSGGCSLSSRADKCFSCRKFLLGSKCKESCPPRMVYDIISRSYVKNKDFRFALGNLCVKKCPNHYMEDDSSCVKQCTPGKTYPSPDRMKCLPCTEEKCASVCQQADLEKAVYDRKKDLPLFDHLYDAKGKRFFFTTRSMLKALLNCTTYEGNVILTGLSVKKLAKLDEDVRFEDLFNLRNLKHINGYVHLDFKAMNSATNLSFFSNLESITSSARVGLTVVFCKAPYLGWRKLRKINVRIVTLAKLPNMCFLQEFKARVPSTTRVLIKGVKPFETCIKEGHKCDNNCNPKFGCWGPGNSMCVRCLNKRAGDMCVKKCEDSIGYYTIPGNSTCGKCNPQCKSGCSGSNDNQCIGGCKFAKLDARCVAKCPLIYYRDDKGVCQKCKKACYVIGESKIYKRTDPACLGPEPRRSPKGCTQCHIVGLDRNLKQKECASTCPKTGFHSTWMTEEHVIMNKGYLTKKDVSLRTLVCLACHQACETCYRNRHDTCTSCKKNYYWTSPNTCTRECIGNFYKSEKGVKTCLPCHSSCRKGCTGPRSTNCFSCEHYRNYLDKSKKTWNCTSSCPAGKNFTERDADSKDMMCVVALSSRGGRRLVLGLSLGLIAFVLLIVAIIIFVCVQRRRAKLLRDRDRLRARYTRQIQDEMPPISSTDYEPNAGQLRMIGSKYLTKGREIGCGAFGTVFKGIWRPPKEKEGDVEISIDVAIKELKESGSLTTTKEFLDEAHVMASVDHHFCIQLLGVCLTSHMQLITEFMPLGCLKDYLPAHKEELGSQQLMTWIVQIVKGMAYLESRGIVHRDLAARNVLLQNKDQIRITDFGLAKLLDPSGDEIQSMSGRFPIRWLALECLSDRIFSSKSDVWSFGVTCWEMFTFGSIRPYQDVPAQNLYDFLDAGERLSQPEICTLDIYMVLIKCWLTEAESRPSFEELVEELSKMASDPGRYLIIKHDKLRHVTARDSSCENSTSPRVSAILPGDKPFKQPAAVVMPDENLPHLTAEIAGRAAAPSSLSDHYTEDPIHSPTRTSHRPAPPVPLASLDEADVETGEFAVEDDYLLPDANDDYVPPSVTSPLPPQTPGSDHEYMNEAVPRNRTVHNPRYKSDIEPVMDDDYLAPDPLNDTRDSQYSDMDGGGYLDPLITKSGSPAVNPSTRV